MAVYYWRLVLKRLCTCAILLGIINHLSVARIINLGGQGSKRSRQFDRNYVLHRSGISLQYHRHDSPRYQAYTRSD
jgi:hypothetical protein